MAGNQSFAATCEDYNSDNGETVPDTRKQANAAAKRSHPSDSGKTPTVHTAGRDAASDSGYSSHTAATLGSADLPLYPAPVPAPAPAVPSMQHQQHSTRANSTSSSAGDGIRVRAKASSDSGSSTARRRSNNTGRPSMRTDGRSQSKSSSSGGASVNMPASPLNSSRPSRSESQTRRNRQQGRAEEECHNPSCTCRGDRRRAPSSPGGRPNLGPLPPYAGVAQPHPSPSSSMYYGPPSPRTQRYPAGFAPMIVEASPSPRRTGPMPRARPTSYHAGMSQEALWASRMGFATHHPQGPPPSFSAYANPPQPPHMFYPQANLNSAPLSYQPLHPGQDRPPMPEHARGAPPQRPAVNYSTRRPASTFGPPPPQIHYEPPTPGFPPSHAGANSNPSAWQPSARHSGQMFSPPLMTHPAGNYDYSTSESSSESDEDEFEEYDSRSMPPPPGPMPRKRPEIRHAATVNYPIRPTAREVKPHSSTRTHIIDDARSNPASASSSRRPSLVHHRTKSKSYAEAGATTTVESSTARRRMSYRAHEQRNTHVDGAQRAAEAYQADVSARAQSNRRRRDAEGTSSTRDGGRSSNRRSVVIDGHKLSSTVPLTEEALRKAKPTSRLETLAAAPSESGSGRSKASSSRNDNNDSRSANARVGLQGRTLSGDSSNSKMPGSGDANAANADGSTSPVNESLSVQINGLNLELQGMEGKTFSLRTQEDGKPQLVVEDVGENERLRQHSGAQEHHVVQDRERYREHARESSYRAQSRSRGAVGAHDDYDDAERERRTRRRRSSNRTESYSRPTNAGAGGRDAPTVASSSITSSSAASRGSLHRNQMYRNEDDGTREYYSPRRAKPVRYPSTRSSQPRIVPVVHDRRSGDRMPSRSRSPRRSRSRYRSQSGQNASAASKMTKPMTRRERRYVGSDEDSSDDEDTAREYQAPSSSSSLATAYMYTGRGGGVGGRGSAAATVAAKALRNNREEQDRYTDVDSASRVGGSVATTGSGSTGRRSSIVGKLRGKYEEHLRGQLRGSNSRSRQQAGRPSSVVGSAVSSTVFDDDDEDDTDEETNERSVRGHGAVQNWI